MKVLYISASDVPSSAANSIHVVKMCHALASLGHSVSLTACRQTDQSASEVLPAVYGVSANFQLLSMRIPKIPGFSYLHGLMAYQYVPRLSPDLVFTRSLHAAVLAAARGWPVIFESHSPIADTGKVNHRLFRWLVRRPSFLGLIVITHALKEYYLQYYDDLHSDDVFVAPDGADKVPDCTTRIEKQQEGRLRVGYVGHLYPGKGMEVVVPLAREASWADFIVVGGNDADVQHWKGQAHDVENLSFVGHKPHSEVQGYLDTFDVVLLPNQLRVTTSGGKSDIGRWTSPLKAFEYMAAGKAILASDIPVLREVLEDGVNALLCKPDDIGSWLKTLEKLGGEPELLNDLGLKARELFERQYTWRARAEKIVDFAAKNLELYHR